jgi:hypothetical protein
MQTTMERTHESEHAALALAWVRWNGQRGTAAQVARIMRVLSMDSLRRMLTARGIQAGLGR